jgi:hypothetical protein
MAVLAAIFFLPAIIAAVRGHNVLAIFLLNLFLGLTGIGWVCALVWSVSDKVAAAPRA